MAVVASNGIVQTPLVEVLHGNMQLAVVVRALDERVLAVEHNVVVGISPLVSPRAARLAIGALDEQLIQHSLDDLGHRPRVLLRIDILATRRTRSAAVVLLLGSPSMVEAVAAEEVAADELNGAVEGRVADEADEVAVGGVEVLEEVQVGLLLGGEGAAVLRVQ